MPVPAGEITASIKMTLASQPAPTASASVYHAPTLEMLPSGSSQLLAMLAGSTAPIMTTCSAAYSAEPRNIAIRMARARSRWGLRASPASCAHCSKPCAANTTPPVSAAKTPCQPWARSRRRP